MSLSSRAHAAFLQYFGYQPSHEIHAPGRVNLIGEHTDYNGGFVLPAAINYGITVVAHKRDDSLIRACAINFDREIAEFDLSQPIESVTSKTWSNYLRGVCKYLLEAGYELQGVDLVVIGDVPYGAGLSSSAAFEIVMVRTFTEISDQTIDPTDAALLGQKTENQFIGANTGIMDQLISARGKADHALLIDCESLQTQAIPLDSDYAIVIFNSNVKRGLVDSEYNARREQCQQAANILGVSALRHASLDQLETSKAQMSELIYRRARHVISENDRTLNAAKVLKDRDWQQLGILMAESHRSMKEDFEITVPPIDGLVEIINQHLPAGAGGARMTGGGFGGCVVSIIEQSQVESAIAEVKKHYQRRFGLEESVYICHAVNGAFAQ
ncbi:MAG: galactokinase [Reinekea sp.]|jgi:galactokinase